MASAKLTFGCSVAVDGYWDVAEMARRAEALGFDRIAMGEHVMDGNPPRPTLMNIPAMAAAAAIAGHFVDIREWPVGHNDSGG